MRVCTCDSTIRLLGRYSRGRVTNPRGPRPRPPVPSPSTAHPPSSARTGPRPPYRPLVAQRSPACPASGWGWGVRLGSRGPYHRATRLAGRVDARRQARALTEMAGVGGGSGRVAPVSSPVCGGSRRPWFGCSVRVGGLMWNRSSSDDACWMYVAAERLGGPPRVQCHEYFP